LKTQTSAPTSRPPTPADEDRVLRPYNSIDNSKLSRASKRFSPASARVARKPGPAETGGMSSSRRSMSPLFDPELLASIERELSEEGAHIKRVIGSDKPKQPKVVPAIVAEGRCPPGGSDAVMLYTTTIRGIRKTFEECNAVRAAIEAHDVKLIERDVSMDTGYRARGSCGCPPLFVRGKHVGGALEVTKMEEEGKLKALLQGLPRARVWCAGCAGVTA
jgi:glutaredoxin